MTAITAPPTGRTATNGPSQVLGSVNVVWFAARMMLATDLQDAEYPARTADDPTLKSVFRLSSTTFVNMHCSQLRRAETVSARHKQAALSLQAWIAEVAEVQFVAQVVLTTPSAIVRISVVVKFCLLTVTLKATARLASAKTRTKDMKGNIMGPVIKSVKLNEEGSCKNRKSAEFKDVKTKF